MKSFVYRGIETGIPHIVEGPERAVRVIDGERCELEGPTCEPDTDSLWGGSGWAEPEPSGGASTEKGYMISQSLPFNWPYAKMAGCEFDKRGRPVFTSMNQQKEALRIAQSHGEPVVYDP